MRVKFPFPFQDRDVVFQRVIGTKSSHEGYLVCYSIDRADIQSTKGVVRANMSKCERLLFVSKLTYRSPRYHRAYSAGGTYQKFVDDDDKF